MSGCWVSLILSQILLDFFHHVMMKSCSFKLERDSYFIINAADSRMVESKTEMQDLFKVKHSKQNTSQATEWQEKLNQQAGVVVGC